MEATGLYTHEGKGQTFGCRLLLSDRSLYIYLDNAEKELLIWTPESAHARLMGTVLHLQHKRDPQQRLECSDAVARTWYEAWQQPAPPQKKRAKTSGPVYAFFIGVLLLLLSVIVLAYIYVLPWAAARAVSLIPVSSEISIGEQIAKVYDKEQNDSADHYATLFIRKLKSGSPYPMKVTVIDSPEINAFAVPGGHIFIYTGLLDKMTSYEQLAALLGHEMTHVLKRHSLKSMMRQAASGLVIAAVFGDVSDLTPWLVSKADQFSQLDYSRDLETEADKEGLLLMKDKQIDPQGMLQLLELLKTENEETPALMKYLSTHPDTEARIKEVKTALQEGDFQLRQQQELKFLFEKIKRRPAGAF